MRVYYKTAYMPNIIFYKHNVKQVSQLVYCITNF